MLFLSTASPPAETASSRTLAEGMVVSKLPGGMVAVRVQDNEAATNEASNASGDFLGKKVLFPDSSTGVVVAYRPPLVFCFTESPIDVMDGTVEVSSEMIKIQASGSGTAVDCFGRPLDGPSSTSNVELAPHALFHPIPKVSEISLINTPLLTGTTMLDTLAPIGRGQNMIMIGHDINNMRGIAVDLLKTQYHATKCVYVSTENACVSRQRLKDGGVLSDVHFVGMRDQLTDNDDTVSKATEAVTAASTGCAIAESFAEKGQHTLVVVDTMDLHKQFWDATTHTLVDVFGVDAVVQSDRSGGASSEMRGFYSSLIQRAGQYNTRKGGGSVTLLLMTVIPRMLNDSSDSVFNPSDFDERVKERIDLLIKRNIPLTEANLRKINIPIPSLSEGARRLVLQHVDDLISMSDGQIWLDERLEARGQQPPMDPQRSITRIGIGADTVSRADAPALRRIAEGLRLDLSQAASMEGAEATAASEKQIRRQRALLLSMHQKAGSGGRRVSESCVALLAAKEGLLDDAVDQGKVAGTPEGDELIESLLAHVAITAAGSMAEIDAELDISGRAKEELLASMTDFFRS